MAIVEAAASLVASLDPRLLLGRALFLRALQSSVSAKFIDVRLCWVRFEENGIICNGTRVKINKSCACVNQIVNLYEIGNETVVGLPAYWLFLKYNCKTTL